MYPRLVGALLLALTAPSVLGAAIYSSVSVGPVPPSASVGPGSSPVSTSLLPRGSPSGSIGQRTDELNDRDTTVDEDPAEASGLSEEDLDELEARQVTYITGTESGPLTQVIQVSDSQGYYLSLPEHVCPNTIVPGQFISPGTLTVTNATLAQIQTQIRKLDAASAQNYLSNVAGGLETQLINTFEAHLCGGDVTQLEQAGLGTKHKLMMARQEGNWAWGGGFWLASFLSVVPGALVAKFVAYDYTLPAANQTITYGQESDVLTTLGAAWLVLVLVVQHVSKATMGRGEILLTSILLTIIQNINAVAIAAFAAATQACMNFDNLVQGLQVDFNQGGVPVVPADARVIPEPIGGGEFVPAQIPLADMC